MILSPMLLSLLIKNGVLNRRRWWSMVVKLPVVVFMIYTIWDFNTNRDMNRTFWCVLIFNSSAMIESFDFMLFIGFLNVVSDEVRFCLIF